MATIIGTSAAWHDITVVLRRYGLDVKSPDEINSLLAHLLRSYTPEVEKKKFEIFQKIGVIKQQIFILRKENGIWRRFFSWFRILKYKLQIADLNKEEENYINLLSKHIQVLKNIQGSPELVGAQTELEVIKNLSRLPSKYIVLNGVELTAHRFIRFNRVPLSSAQIDHIVLCSAGVFVIETKRWSKKFTASGNYHDPFDQVQRASYLCYDNLRAIFGKIRIRSLIASAGYLPEPPKNSYTKVVSVSNISGYISWFKKEEISEKHLMRIRHYLERYVTTIKPF